MGGDQKTQGEPPKNFKDALYWIPGSKNRSDLGSKYLTFDQSCPNAKMIKVEDIDPRLVSNQDIAWMKNIPGTIQDKTILSARAIENEKVNKEDEPNFISGFKRQGVSKIKAEASIVLRDQEGKAAVFRVNTGSEGSEPNKVLSVGDPEDYETEDGDADLIMPTLGLMTRRHCLF